MTVDVHSGGVVRGPLRLISSGSDGHRCAVGHLARRSGSAWQQGRLRFGLELAEEAVRAAKADSSCACRHVSEIFLAMGLTQVREFGRARELLGPGGLDTRFDHRPEETGPLALARSYLAFAMGDLGTAGDAAEHGLAHAEEFGQRSWRAVGHLLLTQIAYRRVDMKSASYYMKRLSEDALLGRSAGIAGQCAWVAVQVCEAQSGTGAAVQLIEELVDFGPVSRELLIAQPAAAPWLVRLSLSTNEMDLAEQGVGAATRLAAMNPGLPSVAAAALHAKGLIEQSLDDLRLAAETHADPWARASATEDVATQLVVCGQFDDAVDTLEGASDKYLVLGASRDLSRVKGKLRDLGVRHHNSRWSDRSRTAAVCDLTETEYAVAQLVAEGLTNSQAATQLFLSRHTIAFHLRKIFRKLDVVSRVELARTWSATVGDAGSSI